MPLFSANLHITQGATFRKVFVFKSGGAVVDLTGYTGRAQIRTSAASLTVICDLTTENGGITINGPQGMVSLYISPTETAGFDFSATGGVYDVELYHPTDETEVLSLVGGLVKLMLEVTRG